MVAKKPIPKDLEIATQYVSAFSESTAFCMLGKNDIHCQIICRHRGSEVPSDIRVENWKGDVVRPITAVVDGL